MEVHIVGAANHKDYPDELEANFVLRHKVFVEKLKWEAIRRADARDVDQFDNDQSTHLLLMDDGVVAGGARFTSLSHPTLLTSVFSGMVERDLPGPLHLGADWTRFYVANPGHAKVGPNSGSSVLFCAAMEYGLAERLGYFTFVSRLAMLELLTSLGWKVSPLGRPQMIDGALTIAASIEISEEALFKVQTFTGLTESVVRRRHSLHGSVPLHLMASSGNPSSMIH